MNDYWKMKVMRDKSKKGKGDASPPEALKNKHYERILKKLHVESAILQPLERLFAGA